MLKADYNAVLRFQKYLLMALLLVFPVYWVLSPVFIVLLFLSVLPGIGFSYRQFASLSKKNIFMFSYVALFLLYLIGLSYSENMHQGLVSIETKLSFLVLPLVILGLQVDFFALRNRKLFLYCLLTGACVAGIIMTTYSIFFFPYNELVTKILNPKFYHHTYYSLYLNIVICFVLSDYKSKLLHPQLRSGALLLFSGLVYLSNSRTGLIVLALLFVIYFISVLVSKKRPVYHYLLVLFLFAGIGTLVSLQPSVNRTITLITKSADWLTLAKAGGMARVDIWTVAAQKIGESPFLGYGTGASNDILYEGYLQADLFSFAERRYNAHNQYMQIWLDVGLPGFCLLLLFFVVGYYQSYQAGSILLFMVLTVFAVAFLFESILNRFMGVFPFVFFPLFLVYLYLPYSDNLVEEHNL